MTSFGQFTENNRSETGHDSPKNISFLDEQVTALKAQLEKAEQRETALIEEKKELREMLKNEQARTLALSPPPKPRFWRQVIGK